MYDYYIQAPKSLFQSVPGILDAKSKQVRSQQSSQWGTEANVALWAGPFGKNQCTLVRVSTVQYIISTDVSHAHMMKTYKYQRGFCDWEDNNVEKHYCLSSLKP